MSRVVSIGNNKGGVGKTSVVMGLAAALARRGKRVLAVDLDPQANLTRRLGYRSTPDDPPIPTVSEAIKANEAGCAADIVLHARWPVAEAELIDFLPSVFDLENRATEAGSLGALRRLKKALTGVTDAYDWTLIDCPPSLGHLTQMGMVASDSVLIVLTPEYDAIDGAVRLRDFVRDYAGDLGVPNLKIDGVIVNFVRERTGLHTFHLDTLTATFADLQWAPVIPQRTLLAEANDAGAPIHSYTGPVAGELTAVYDRLADQLEATTA